MPAAEDRAAEDPARAHWLTRFAFFRLLGLVYVVAFLIILDQWGPLLGSHGLLPAANSLKEAGNAWGRGPAAFLRLPTLFWLGASDEAFRLAAWLGLALALALLFGFANVLSLASLWLLYMSFVHVGQIFYGYGWEILLLETGFLAIFLAPLWRPGPFSGDAPPSRVVIVLLRWLLFRLMLGAGLIKLRGDPCWRDLTCLVFHYETQPNPNPLSWYLHQLPAWFHELEVLFNHLVELVAPFFVFGPRRARLAAGGLMVSFQVLLILSGNLSFLNWLTLAVAVACFDDGLLRRLLPARLADRLEAAVAGVEESRARGLACYALAVVVVFLSLNPVGNMLLPGQVMNTSFDPFDLVNTYGAFGTIGRERYEIVLEGTDDDPSSPRARWEEYEFECKPGNPARRPCWISPYHYRLDWQMWFLAMPGAPVDEWFVRLVAKLLDGDRGARGLLARGPFEERPPRAIRALYYRYQMTRHGDATRDYWKRTLVGEYLPPVTREDPRLREYLRSADGDQPSTASRRAKAPFAPVCHSQAGRGDEGGPLDALDQELGHALARGDTERLVSVVDEHDAHLAPVVAVDDAGERVDPVAHGEAAARPHEPHVARWNLNPQARGHCGAPAGRDLEGGARAEVGPRRPGRGVLGQRAALAHVDGKDQGSGSVHLLTHGAVRRDGTPEESRGAVLSSADAPGESLRDGACGARDRRRGDGGARLPRAPAPRLAPPSSCADHRGDGQPAEGPPCAARGGLRGALAGGV
jgi:hypothetical protein